MPNRGKQGGFGLMETVLALSLTAIILVTVIPLGIRYYQQKQVDEFVANIKHLVTQIQLYQYHKTSREGVTSDPMKPGYFEGWPASFDALMTDYGSAFVEFCGPTNESSGACIRPDTLPFTTEKLTFEELPGYPNKLFLIVPTGTFPNDGPRARWGRPLLSIPDTLVRPDGNIQISLRPLTKSIMYDEFLRKDGSVHLTQDWDVGGQFGITNTRDLTIRNIDGSQTRVSNKLTDIYTVEHGEWLSKPKCPNGLMAEVNPTITSVDFHPSYDLTGSQRAYVIQETSTQWQFGLDALAVHKSSGTKRFLNGGVITAFVQCK